MSYNAILILTMKTTLLIIVKDNLTTKECMHHEAKKKYTNYC